MSSAIQLGFEAIERAAEGHAPELARLIPVAQRLARERGTVTIADVRVEAVKLGLLPAESHGRRLSYLGKLLEAAGLVATSEWRRSEIPQSHGNLQRVYRWSP